MIADSDGAVRPLITHKIHICTLSFALFAQFAAIIPGQAFNIQVRDPTPYGDVDLCAADDLAVLDDMCALCNGGYCNFVAGGMSSVVMTEQSSAPLK